MMPASMTETARIYGGAFEPANRNNPRTLIAGWVPQSARVLDVGPGDGVISRWLRQNKACESVGVEYVAEAAERARPDFRRMIVGSIEDDAVLAQAAAAGPYDAVIFADVLEHLVDPWRVLRAVRPMLAPTGRVLLSMPNVAHWIVRLNLLMGRWDLTEGYIMDRTHLRWFTRRTARQMAHETGYTVEAIETVFKPRFIRIWPALMGYQTVLKLAPLTA